MMEEVLEVEQIEPPAKRLRLLKRGLDGRRFQPEGSDSDVWSVSDSDQEFIPSESEGEESWTPSPPAQRRQKTFASIAWQDSRLAVPSDASTGISSGSSASSGSSSRFPDTGWADAMFQHFRQPLEEAAKTGLGSRAIKLGTDCSGAEAPWFALKAICSELASQLAVNLKVQHQFACDILPISQHFIVQNSKPMFLFEDLRERTDVGYCLQSEMMMPVPSHLDLYVAGFPCKDFSILNSKRPCLQGPHAATFHGVVGYIKRHQPATFLLENVQGIAMRKKGEAKAPITEVMEILRALDGYEVKGWKVNSSDYHLPQNRVRVYIVGVHRRAKLRRPLDAWSVSIRGMAKRSKVPAQSFLLDDSEIEVQSELERLEIQQVERGRMPIAGGRWIEVNRQIRKQLGVRPEEGPLIPKGCGWSRFLSQRVQDTLELQAIRALKKVKGGKDLSRLNLFAEISRSVLYGSCRPRETPCLTPGSKIWAYTRQRWLIGPEMLALQGFPVDELNLEGLTDQHIRFLAGNAMSVPVVGLFLYAIFAFVEFDSEPDPMTLD